jgi:pimeloyl-ACP methyl ester carboxylesterase
MSPVTTTMTLTDGRDVDVFLGGDDHGFPLLMHHGTPSDSTTFADWHDHCEANGLRLVCASRGGYATSTRHAGRTVADVATDATELLGELGHHQFVTAGWSGGGPHALACAALLPDRCVAVATLAGVGTFAQGDLDFLDGMGPENVAEFGAAVAGEAKLREWMTEFGSPFRQVTGSDIAEAFGGLVPEIDKDVLTGGYADQMAAETRRALEHGMDGWIDDDLAFTSPWGFELGDIQIPATVWQGDLDLMVPFAHGEWLTKQLPNAESRMVPGHGHISLVTEYRGEILKTLLAHISD